MKKAIVFLPIAVVLFMGGCLATQGNLDSVNHQLNVLNSNINDMRKNQAELNSKMDALSGQVTQSSELSKDISKSLARISAKIDDIQVVVARLDKPKVGTDMMVPSQLYAQAQTYLMQKKYDEAIKGFELYLEKYPEGELAEDAMYYLGDAHFGLKSWQNAAVSYAKMLTAYPESKYTASARLKYAQSLLKLADAAKKEEAINYLKSIIQDYPDYPESRIAKDTLKELNIKSDTK